ncbi:MAG: 4Fe-4S binding protein [Phycisphaerae bacterium]|nr:4Fe-4S binding protein [Phycisphaerae bacterium]
MIRHVRLTLMLYGLICLGPWPVVQTVHAQPETTAASTALSEARRIAGMVLSQNALAEHILVIGSDSALVHTLLISKTVQSVTWAPPAPESIDNPPRVSSPADARLILHTGTVRSLLDTHAKAYDIILINFPDPTHRACRDTLSQDFQTLIQQALTPTGLAAFRVPGSTARALPPHHLFLDATLFQQLQTRFLQTLLVPGEPLFFLCSNTAYMTTYAPRLEARFSLLDEYEAILPRGQLSDIYDLERASQLRAQFETVDPSIPFKLGLYRLLQAADKLHMNLIPALKPIRETGLWYLSIFTLIGVITRVLYVTRNRPGSSINPPSLLTPLGYGLFWFGLSLILVVQVTDYLNRPRLDSPLMRSVPEWTDGLQVTSKDLAASETAAPVPYQEVRDNKRLTGYIFQTRDFTGTVYGYGGPIGLILFVTPDGTLMDFRFTQSYETPRYIRRIQGWLDALKTRSIFGPAPLKDVYAVSGATLTTRAVMHLMRESGQQFAAQVLAQTPRPSMNHRLMMLLMQKGLLLLIIGLCLAVMAILHGKLWSRLVVLLYSTLVFGFWLNKQYATDHILRVLAWDNILSGTPEFLALLLGAPVLILLFGNLYCGYLCPFGAIQELISFIIPKRVRPRLSHTTVQGARFLKYAVLFALILGVFLFKDKDSVLIDPLTTVFNRHLWPDLFLTPLWLFVGLGVVFVTRFWCRVLCPTGAFLSLLNRCAWLQRLLPAKKFGRCEFGLTGRDHMDCIYCDRCRYENNLIPERNQAITKDPPNLISRLFLCWILIAASLLIWPLVHKSTPVTDPNTPGTVVQDK